MKGSTLSKMTQRQLPRFKEGFTSNLLVDVGLKTVDFGSHCSDSLQDFLLWFKKTQKTLKVNVFLYHINPKVKISGFIFS